MIANDLPDSAKAVEGVGLAVERVGLAFLWECKFIAGMLRYTINLTFGH